jgi:single-stranded DNA-binding protein
VQEINITVLSGNISDVIYSRTATKGDDVCSFTIFIDKDREHTTLVRVNIFGPLTLACKDREMQKGDFVIVEGELMNRVLKTTQERALEVRCRDIKIFKTQSRTIIKEEGVTA